MRNRMFRRMVAAVIGLSLVAWAPASLLCPLDGNDPAQAAHAGAAEAHVGPMQHGAPAHGEHAPTQAPADSPDCPLAFVAGCIPSVLATSVARLTEPFADRAAEPDWVVATESDRTDTSSIFHPPIG